MKDLEKRKRVMARSMQLGHCICDPKKPCPCDILLEQDICPCAGERLEATSGPIRLTSLVDRPGCASKIDEAALEKVLKGLPTVDDPRVLVGVPAGDDAGVFQLDGDTALVQTVDVFSPSVDDPYVFGQIAAANSLSDAYAMGGRPITALSIIGFPIRVVPDEVMHRILRGGIDKMAEAGVAVIGGHSINDKEIKAGFAVTGLVNTDRIITNARAQPGDRLILTKPVGTGIIAFAAQIDQAPPGAPEAAARWMATLNKAASEVMADFDAHACTDVTGFGLMGHLARMVSASNVDVEIIWDDIPLLPGVLECLAAGIVSGAAERNRESSGHCVVAEDSVAPAMLDLCFDPQTSGGLLIAAAPSQAEPLLARLRETGATESAIIGTVRSPGSGRVFVRSDGRRRIPASPKPASGPAAVFAAAAASPSLASQEPSDMTSDTSCCGGSHSSPNDAAKAAGGTSEIEAKFHEFLQAAGAPGALDARTKRAISIALSVLAKCEPCVKSHIKKAREMGFSQQEIDEAAWLAVSFGGCPAMMFYKGVRRS